MASLVRNVGGRRQAGGVDSGRGALLRAFMVGLMAGFLLELAAAKVPPSRRPPPLRLGLWDVWVEVPAGDPEAAAPVLEAAAAALARRPVELVWADRTWRFTLDQLGVELDRAALVTGGLSRLEQLSGHLRTAPAVAPAARLREDRLAEALKAVEAVVAVEPVPARLVAEGDAVRVEPDVPGRRLDRFRLTAELRDRLARAPLARRPWRPDDPLPPLRIQVPTAPAEAAPTLRELEALGIRRLLARFTTRYDAGVPRGENVERAARALDGTLLRPGEVLSYNARVGPVDAAHGWQPAPVIAGGRLVEGVGGGICQTATTLYGAALRAGLQVLERHPHALPVRYIPPSQDAAVAPGFQDLKLRNAGETAVWIRAWAGDGEVTVAIYGDGPPDLTFDVVTEVQGEVPPPVQVEPDPSLEPGEERVVREGIPGIQSTGYRLHFRSGVLVRREWLSSDTYPPSPRVVRRG